MAKRKAARATKKAKAATRKPARRAAKKKAAPQKAARRVPARKAAPKKKTAARKAVARKAAPRKAVAKKTVRKKTGRKTVGRTGPAKRTHHVPAKRVASAKAPAPKARRATSLPERKAPSLDRARRVVLDDDIVATPPSTLDMDRTASAARSGRKAFRDRLEDHHETSPALTAGDVDADWESAYSVGDEAPGGDNPTPDQDIVDDIGRAVGNEYQDNEPLKGADKIIQRDKHRWELDPGSKEDFDEED